MFSFRIRSQIYKNLQLKIAQEVKKLFILI